MSHLSEVAAVQRTGDPGFLEDRMQERENTALELTVLPASLDFFLSCFQTHGIPIDEVWPKAGTRFFSEYI